MLDHETEAPCSIYDAAFFEPEDHARALLGGEESENGAVLVACEGGSLIVRHAERVARSLWLTLCQEAEAHEVRLYLCVDSDEAASRSIVEGADPALAEVFEGREIVIPTLRERDAVRAVILDHLFEEEAWLQGKTIEGVSIQARESLDAYAWPGQIDEARAVIASAVRRVSGDRIDTHDLPVEVR